MKNGTIQVICGRGCGKTAMAIGKGVVAVSNHKKVIMIQFLKGNIYSETSSKLKILEPDMKVFHFEKAEAYFEHLTELEKQEELINIKNALNFTKKVLGTGECDVLILDEILGLLDLNIITEEQFLEILIGKDPEMDVVLTGQIFPEHLHSHVDRVTKIDNVKVDKTI